MLTNKLLYHALLKEKGFFYKKKVIIDLVVCFDGQVEKGRVHQQVLETEALRQYLYFYTSKASKLSTLRNNLRSSPRREEERSTISGAFGSTNGLL
jgi:hypothetical protein